MEIALIICGTLLLALIILVGAALLLDRQRHQRPEPKPKVRVDFGGTDPQVAVEQIQKTLDNYGRQIRRERGL